MIVDLHCHSTASDGELPPAQLLALAQERGIELLAITDHDTVAGYREAQALQQESSSTRLLPGVELSCVWGKRTIHIVGLGGNPDHPELQQGLESLSHARQLRAVVIGEKLAKRGFDGAYEGALALAAGSQIGRPHFARFLVDEGHVKSFNEAFKRYLGAGKPGDVKAMWPEMAQVVHWISASGAVAVLAHPLKYKLTATRLRALLADFSSAGGGAMEVVSGQQNSEQTRYLAGLCNNFDLLASRGSDFHKPGFPWSELGASSPLPESCRPVWESLIKI